MYSSTFVSGALRHWGEEGSDAEVIIQLVRMSGIIAFVLGVLG